jgi:hypothetical protein
MKSVSKLCRALAAAPWIIVAGWVGDCAAQGSGLDFLASLIGPAAYAPARVIPAEDWAERVLALPLTIPSPHIRDRSDADLDQGEQPPAVARRETHLSSSFEAAGLDRFLWGRRHGLAHEPFGRLAALHPPTSSGEGLARALVDEPNRLKSVGRLVTDGSRLYSKLEIEVEISKFTLKLFGYRGQEKRLIYSTRVGLGSAEFPTPRGSFVIARIFDDKPLWIPPPDREWAWGQSPSHSVYGGHMMPLLQKKPEVNRPLVSASDDVPDIIAPRVQMIDSGAYRVHGTDSPWSIGSGQSHGCVRMLNSTVAELANNLKLYAGTADRGVSPNGPYVNLARPVKFVLR